MDVKQKSEVPKAIQTFSPESSTDPSVIQPYCWDISSKCRRWRLETHYAWRQCHQCSKIQQTLAKGLIVWRHSVWQFAWLLSPIFRAHSLSSSNKQGMLNQDVQLFIRTVCQQYTKEINKLWVWQEKRTSWFDDRWAAVGVNMLLQTQPVLQLK